MKTEFCYLNTETNKCKYYLNLLLPVNKIALGGLKQNA
jgi:hypothetical protein